jgi:hypothetical protein
VDLLIETLKNHGMKLMMDLVVNHTSDQHAWFRESASSKDSSKRDWYIWKPPKGFDDAGKPLPPNNWAGILGDSLSAWNWHAETQEFYLALHSPEQVDLNWENAEVVTAVYDVSFINRQKLFQRLVQCFHILINTILSPQRPQTKIIAKYVPGHGILVESRYRRVSHGCHQSHIQTPVFPRRSGH